MKNPLRFSPHPLLLEIAVRPWIRRFNPREPRSLDDVPEAEIARIRSAGFHGVWLMGVWPTGELARRAALEHESLREEYARVLPDWTEDDVEGSPYAIREYRAASNLGGETALARFRERLHEHDLGLVLDFVPNHLGRDHAWLDTHPERLIRGTEDDLAQTPENWFLHERDGARTIFAHGRDPHFAGWTDTVQVEYRKPESRAAMIEILTRLAGISDGVRCDVAMLVLSEVFSQTWGGEAIDPEFWSEAIAAVRVQRPDFVFIAEVYWGLESRLHDLGFDFAYDKELYDKLVHRDLEGARQQLSAPANEHRYRVHFLENHDEPRAFATISDRTPAVATAAYALPGLRFFFEGQCEGRAIRIPVQLSREPEEAPVVWCREFYERMLECLRHEVFHRGTWSWVAVEDSSALVACRWDLESEHWLIVANLGGEAANGHAVFDAAPPRQGEVHLVEQISGETRVLPRGQARVLLALEGGAAQWWRATT